MTIYRTLYEFVMSVTIIFLASAGCVIRTINDYFIFLDKIVLSIVVEEIVFCW